MFELTCGKSHKIWPVSNEEKNPSRNQKLNIFKCIKGCLLCLSHRIWKQIHCQIGSPFQSPPISISPLASVARWILNSLSTDNKSSSACAPAPRSFAWLIRQKKIALQVIPSSLWLCKAEAVEVYLERALLFSRTESWWYSWRWWNLWGDVLLMMNESKIFESIFLLH